MVTYDRNATSAPVPGLRLLPWESDTGKPCFLSPDGSRSALSRIADEIEADQLRDGADVAEGAQAVLDDRKAGEYALRLALRAATQALVAVVRVADSRGARLSVPGDSPARTDSPPDGRGTVEPELPAASHDDDRRATASTAKEHRYQHAPHP
ncbi:hypothetical protein [Streptomyces inhibens]|uniref:hypothetical protein n=1 Tax=Streptomyces inhibens TaxID=2293571 RepID=UPI00315A112E